MNYSLILKKFWSSNIWIPRWTTWSRTWTSASIIREYEHHKYFYFIHIYIQLINQRYVKITINFSIYNLSSSYSQLNHNSIFNFSFICFHFTMFTFTITSDASRLVFVCHFKLLTLTFSPHIHALEISGFNSNLGYK